MNGINAIPRTHNGEGLAYISPEEAMWLRQMGGGVPTNPQTGQPNPINAQTGQPNQLLGPGDVPSFAFGTGTGIGTGFGAYGGMGVAGSTGIGAGIGATGLGVGPSVPGGAGISAGGAPNWLTSGQYQQPGGGVAPAVEEEEPYSNEPTEEEIAERQAKLDARILAGRDRYLAALQSLGYGPPQALYGETSTGEQLFPEGRTGEQIPAWSGLFGSPAGESIRVALGSDQPAQPAQPGQPSAGLLERVAAIAEGLRPQEPTEPPAQTAAHGGLIGRYDLGGLVNAMMLQASRSRDNIPSNMVL